MTLYDPQKHHRRSTRLKGYNYAQSGAYFITLVSYQREELFGKIANDEMQLSVLGQIARDEWLRSIGLRREIHMNEDEFIIMPNHIHGIVWIVDPVNGLVGADGVRPVDAVGASQEGACHVPLPETSQPRAYPGADAVRPDFGDGVRPMDGDGVHPVDVAGANQLGACHAPLPETSQPRVYPVGADAVRPEGALGTEEGACHAPLRRLPRSLSSFVAGFKAAVTSRARRELNMNGIWQRNYYDHIIRNEQDFLNIWNYIDTNPQKWQVDQLYSSAPANRFNRD